MLTVHLAPAGLCPSGIGDRYMQATVNDSVPVYTREYVSERIKEIVSRHLGHAVGAGSKEYKHPVSAFRRILARRTDERRRVFNALVK